MDQFGNSLNNATNQANQTYATDTANAANAQNQANTQLASVNQEGQNADQNAAKLSALGDTYSNQAQNVNNFNTAEQSQLNTMGFDKNTLNQANQNIAQETGQLGAANNQMAAQGGTRGFNAVGQQTRQANVQNQANNAIAANTQVQSNELGQANAAGTFAGQEMNYELGQNTNAINAYNDAAQQNNNTMANYAQTLNTLANQATTYGGLVGSNVANIMQAANSAAQAALAKYQAQLAVAQANQANAQAGLFSAQTVGQNQQNAYNKQLEAFNVSTQKMVTKNNNAINTQINNLTADINNEKRQVSTNSKNIDTSGGIVKMFLTNLLTNSPADKNKALNTNISSQQSQIQQLKSERLPNAL